MLCPSAAPTLPDNSLQPRYGTDPYIASTSFTWNFDFPMGSLNYVRSLTIAK